MDRSLLVLSSAAKALYLALLLVLLGSCARYELRTRPDLAPVLAIRNLEIFVADRSGNRIARFTDMSGAGWQTRTDAAGRSFNQPTGVFVVRSLFGTGFKGIFVADMLNNRIVRMDDMTSGSPADQFLVTFQNKPAPPFRVTVSGGRIYFTSAPNRLHRIDGMDGSGHLEIRGEDIRMADAGAAGSGAGWANNGLSVVEGRGYQHGIFLGASSRIIQLDSMAPDIGTPSAPLWSALECCVLNGQPGQPVFVTPAPASTGSDPRGIDIDSSRRIWVADTLNHRIVRIDNMGGAGLRVLGGPAAGAGVNQFHDPTAIQVHPTGIYIADSRNNRIVRIQDIDGTGWTEFRGPTGSEFKIPTDIAVVSGY